MIANYDIQNLRFIPKEPSKELLLEDAKNIGKESYIAEKEEKLIIIMAYSFRQEAQNYLLKIFEEPPKNINFLLVCPSKNLLLPTIRSRFIIEMKKEINTKKSLELDLKKLDLKNIYDFLKSKENIDKNELMELITSLSLASCNEFKLNEDDLESFYKAYELAKLNSKPSIILANIFLNLYEKKL